MKSYVDTVPQLLTLLNEHTGEGDTPDPTQDGIEHEYDVYIQDDRITILKKEPQTVEATIPATKPDDTPLVSHKASTILAYSTIILYFFLILATIIFQLNQIFTTSTVIIFIYPQTRTITTTATIQVQGRALIPLTLSQSMTVPATGKGQQNATQAQGTITLYNGSLTEQTVPAGTVLTGTDGIHIITNQTANIPAGSPPSYGQTSVNTHAIKAGSIGNIQPGDISVALSRDLVAKNLAAFSGGQNERNFTFVTRRDLSQAAATLKTSLSKIEGEALNSLIRADEALITPLCSQSVTLDHQAGDEASKVDVSVSETCTGIAYNAHTVYAIATHMLQERASRIFTAAYTLEGTPQVTITHTAISAQAHVTIAVNVTGTFVYKFTQVQSQQIIRLIAGKSPEAARHILDHFPGIQHALIVMNGNTFVPKILKRVIIVIQNPAIA